MEKQLFIKGFDEDLKCRDYQFEVGKTYDTGFSDDELEICTDKVFHFCRNLKQVHKYYSCNEKYENRFCYIEVLGGMVEEDDKCGSNKIKIVRELTKEEFEKETIKTNGNTGLFNSGDYNSGDYNSGDFNSGDRNSGDYNSGDFNSGDRNSGNFNSGDFNSGNRNSGDFNSGNRNSGDFNSGNRNSGSRNSGDFNSGDRNSGNYNSGDFNSGNRNSGNRNSGDFNSGDRNSGYFNTQNGKIYIFNKPTTLSHFDFKNEFGILFRGLIKTEWIYYTEEEMKESIIRRCIGGYLKTYSDKEMWENWYKKLNDKEKQKLFSIPNFDVEVFKEITFIDTSEDFERLEME